LVGTCSVALLLGTLNAQTDPARTPQDPANRQNPARQDPSRTAGDQAGMVKANRILKASDIIGKDVENAAGDDLGDIEDVVIDPDSGRVAYAVLSFGGFLGMGDKLFALPWQSLKSSAKDADKFVLDIDKERLKNAPGFDKDTWPNMADRQWATDIHKYYGRDPYWQGGEGDGNGLGRRGTADAGATRGTPGDFSGVIANQPVQTFTGKVTNIETKSKGSAGEYVCATLETTSMGSKKVVLGPESYIDSTKQQKLRNENVTVKGVQTNHEGEQVIVATEILAADGSTISLRDSSGRAVWGAKGAMDKAKDDVKDGVNKAKDGARDGMEKAKDGMEKHRDDAKRDAQRDADRREMDKKDR
jgi:sporulation protein YlmC with PRC-barrel domain